MTLELSPAMIGFTAVLSLGTGVLFGMYPAVHSTRPDLSTMLKVSLGQPASARAAREPKIRSEQAPRGPRQRHHFTATSIAPRETRLTLAAGPQ